MYVGAREGERLGERVSDHARVGEEVTVVSVLTCWELCGPRVSGFKNLQGRQ